MALPEPEFRSGPFTVAQAREAGMTWQSLQSSMWSRLSRGQYSWARLPLDPILKLRAVQDRMPDAFGFSGPTAGWIHGLDYLPCDPIEVTVPRNSYVRNRAGVKVRRAALAESEIVVRRGFRVTSALRTVCDLGSRRNLVDSVIAIDMATHAGLIDITAIGSYVDKHPGDKGIKRLRRAVGLAEPAAESPMETRLRLIIIGARLPRPCAQVALHDPTGRSIARADLYYPDRRLVIEYDGEGHRDRVVSDGRRQNALVNAGYHVLRFTAPDIYTPASIAAQVRRARDLLAKHPG